MRSAIILLIILVDFAGLYGQSFFNIQPDVGGNDMQGVCRAIISHDSTFTIIGHRFDTTGPGSNIKPWLGEFDYSGELKFLSPLIDTLYEKPFYPDIFVYTHKQGDIYYVDAPRYSDFSYFIPYLFELNIHTGEILRSKLIPNSVYPDYLNAQRSILYDQDTITILTYVEVDDSIKVFITKFDTLFNELDIIEIKSDLRVKFPKYFIEYADRTYEIISIAQFKNEFGENFYNFIYLKSDRFGNILKYKISPATIPITNNLAQAQCVLKNKNGDWVIVGEYIIEYPDSCMFCQVSKPYMFSVSSDFDSLLWETRFFDIPDIIGPYYEVYSITSVDDGYIATADFWNIDIDKFPDSGVLFKAGLNGDSLWMKHYIPLEWDEYRVVWARLIDIKTTPFGSIIAAGEISDRDLQIIRPWILHLDKDGCLIPGCNTVSTEDEYLAEDKKEYFKIYPNPASEEIYLLSAISTSDPVSIQVVSNDGKIVKTRNFTPQSGFQYSLPIDELPSGLYYLILTNTKDLRSESHSFFRQ